MSFSPLANAERRMLAVGNDLVARLELHAIRYFGPRCGDFEPDCAVCKAWALRDGAADLFCD